MLIWEREILMRNIKKILLISLITILPTVAEMPVSALDYKSLGISYTYEASGISVPNKTSTSYMVNQVGFHYSPIPYLMFTLKLGAAGATTSDSNVTTKGDVGLAFKGDISLYSPNFAQILQAIVGFDMTTFSSDHEDGYISLRTARPRLGLNIEAMPFINFEVGLKYNYTFGESTLAQYSKVDIESYEPLLGYFQFTLHNPEAGAFLLIGGDFSREFDTDSNGIYNGALYVSIGTVLRHQKRAKFSRD